MCDKNINAINKEDILYYKEISTNCFTYIDSNELNSLRILNKDIKGDKANSRKTTLNFDEVYDYIRKTKAKRLEISLNGDSHMKVIGSIIENTVTTQLNINSSSKEK